VGVEEAVDALPMRRRGFGALEGPKVVEEIGMILKSKLL